MESRLIGGGEAVAPKAAPSTEAREPHAVSTDLWGRVPLDLPQPSPSLMQHCTIYSIEDAEQRCLDPKSVQVWGE